MLRKTSCRQRHRFSQDLQIVDMDLPYALVSTVLALVTGIGQCIAITIGSPLSGTFIPIVAVAITLTQHVYLKMSKQLRQLDLQAKAPLCSFLLETTSGLATLRALRWTTIYLEKCQVHLKRWQQPFYLFNIAQAWLNMVLDMITAAFAMVTIVVAVATRSTSGAVGIGLALSNVVSIGQSAKNFMSSWNTLEASLGAVARVQQFAAHTPHENGSGNTSFPLPPNAWPNSGKIEIRALSATYS